MLGSCLIPTFPSHSFKMLCFESIDFTKLKCRLNFNFHVFIYSALCFKTQISNFPGFAGSQADTRSLADLCSLILCSYLLPQQSHHHEQQCNVLVRPGLSLSLKLKSGNFLTNLLSWYPREISTWGRGRYHRHSCKTFLNLVPSVGLFFDNLLRSYGKYMLTLQS